MMKKIKHFKSDTELKECYFCGSKHKELSGIRIQTTNHGHRYKDSGLPFRNIYMMKVCQKCFDKLEKKLLKLKP